MLVAIAVGAAIAGHGTLTTLLQGSSSAAQLPGSAGTAAIPCSTRANPIQRENCQFGTTAWELTDPTSGHQIMGYAWQTSTQPGQTLSFSVSTTSPSYDAAIFRMGWYQGDGGRLMLSRIDLPGHSYPIPTPARSTGLITCK
jgi:hypothetical protein